MRAGVTLLVCGIVLISFIEAARWSKWKNLTICNAKPCKCYDDDEKCENGKKIKLRFCIRKDGDTELCKWDEDGGAMKIVQCKNKDVCPGWSDWELEKCDCKKKERNKKRYCNNPPPIHPDVLCLKFDGEHGLEDIDINVPCNCTEEERMETTSTTTTSTTTTTMEPTSALPCCQPGSTTTTESPSEYNLYYDLYADIFSETKQCRKCDSYEMEDDIYMDEDGDDYTDYGDDLHDGSDEDDDCDSTLSLCA